MIPCSSSWSTARPGCAWCCPAGPIRPWAWPGCGPAGSWPNCGPPTCALRQTRLPRCCGRWPGRWGRPCLIRPWPRWPRGPRAGRPGCSSRPCPCAARPTRPPSWPRSPAATAMSWTTWPRKYWSASPSRCRRSCLRRRCWNGSAAGCATPSPAARAARPCSSRWSRPACSCCRSTRCAAGGVTTACSPTCFAPAWSRGRAARLHRNAAAWHEEHGLADEAIRHAVGAGEMTWAARLIERNFDAVYRLRGEAATIQRWISALPAGLLQSRPRLLLAQAQLAGAAGEMEEVQRLADAAERAFAAAADEPFEPSIGRASSLLANVPAHIALCRGFAAQYRGDAEATAAFASQARAELGDDEHLLDYEAHCDLAVAEWLRGRLAAGGGGPG